MRAHWRTVTFFEKDRNLYMCPVYTWRTSLETAPVTGSLLFVAHGYRLSNLSAREIVLRVSCDSANLFLSGVRRVPRTVLWDHHKAQMAMGSDSPADGTSGVDFEVQLQVSWNAPEQGRSYNEAGGGSRLPLLWKIFVCVLIVQYFCNIFINADKYLTIHIIYDILKHIPYICHVTMCL